jgi:nucleoporin POM152
LSDNASGKCKAEKNITKIIHPMPTVKISKGKTSVVDIHEGGDVEILFEFTGTPPFEFT